MAMNWMIWRRYPRQWLNSLLAPRSSTEDAGRREYMLNVILFGAVVLSSVATGAAFADFLQRGQAYRGNPPANQLIILLLVVSLYLASRARFTKEASYLVVGLFFAGATYSIYLWGIDLPLALLAYALVIVMAGVLISSRATLLTAALAGVTIFLVAYLQSTFVIHPDLYWKREMLGVFDAVVIVVMLGIITLIAWLYSREIEKSLLRARTSEGALQAERDRLEEKVVERTEELRRTQLEKMLHLYRFAEFGRLASGFVHDLITPLNVVSLNLEQLQSGADGSPNRATEDSRILRRAIEGTKRMEQFVRAAQQQVRVESLKTAFFLTEELDHVLDILEHRAHQWAVRVVVHCPDSRRQLFQDPVKFNQLLMNLVSNAIDAYVDWPGAEHNRRVAIDVTAAPDDRLQIRIQDWGCGIERQHLARIFEPFFTTKASRHGMGLGLAIAKDIAEKDFQGSLTVQSVRGQGSTFLLTMPLRAGPTI